MFLEDACSSFALCDNVFPYILSRSTLPLQRLKPLVIAVSTFFNLIHDTAERVAFVAFSTPCISLNSTLVLSDVAVTGVPEPQEQHAVIMCKFVRDAMQRMQDLIRGKLVQELGEDTADLAFRLGIHSGSITGGVLRGGKSSKT